MEKEKQNLASVGSTQVKIPFFTNAFPRKVVFNAKKSAKYKIQMLYQSRYDKFLTVNQRKGELCRFTKAQKKTREDGR